MASQPDKLSDVPGSRHKLPGMSEHICELMWHGCMRGDIGGRGNTKTILVIWPVSLIN